MEEVLLSAISHHNEIRIPAEEYLKSQESSPNFMTNLLKVYTSSQDANARLLSLIHCKNTIQRQWHILSTHSKAAPISLEEKSYIKSVLLSTVSEETDIRLSELVKICIANISKHEFYDKWPELSDFLTQNQQHLDLLHMVLKVQSKKMMPTAKNQYKKFVDLIYPHVKQLWATSDNPLFDKIMVQLLTAINDPESITVLMGKAEKFLYTPNGESDLRHILKGLNRIGSKFPDTFKNILESFLNVNALILYEMKPSTGNQSELFKEVCKNLREVITFHEECYEFFKEQAPAFMSKILEHHVWAELWTPWFEGDYQSILDENEADERHLAKLMIFLFSNFADLLPMLINSLHLMPNFPYKKMHAVSVVIGSIPKFTNNTTVSLVDIINLYSGLEIHSQERLGVYKDVLWIIRKWLGQTESFDLIYSTVKSIHEASGGDPIIRYECCLTLKQVIYANSPPQICQSIIQDFSQSLLSLVSELQSPQVVWHLINLISATLEKSSTEKSPVLIESIKQSGLLNVLGTDNEMITMASSKMLEELIRVYSDDLFVLDLVFKFLELKLGSKKSSNFYALWHFSICSLKESEYSVKVAELLLGHFGKVNDRSVHLKILEEYVFLYHDSGYPLDTLLSSLGSAANLIGETEHDSLSLNFHLSVSKISPQWCLPLFSQYQYYLGITRSDVFASMCMTSALCITNTLILMNPELANSLNPDAWIEAMSALVSPYHKTLNCASLLQVLPFMNAEFLARHAENVFKHVVPLVENSKENASSTPYTSFSRTSSSLLAPSVRKVKHSQKGTYDLASLFFLSFNTLRGKGICFELMLDQDKATRFQEVFSVTPRPKSR